MVRDWELSKEAVGIELEVTFSGNALQHSSYILGKELLDPVIPHYPL